VKTINRLEPLTRGDPFKRGYPGKKKAGTPNFTLRSRRVQAPSARVPSPEEENGKSKPFQKEAQPIRIRIGKEGPSKRRNRKGVFEFTERQENLLKKEERQAYKIDKKEGGTKGGIFREFFQMDYIKEKGFPDSLKSAGSLEKAQKKKIA